MAESLRTPPQNIEAETAVLGALMLDANAVYNVVDVLKPHHFYREAHRIIYEAVVELAERHEPADVISVSNHLKGKNKLEAIGGKSFLAELIASVPSAANAAYHADIVHKKGVLREMIEAAGHIHQLGYQEGENVDMLLDEAEQKIFSISQSSLRQKLIPVGTALADAWERIDRLHKNKGELRGIPTGFADLDHVLSGFQASDLVVLAARPSLGKTSLALDIARNAALHHQIPVGLFSLEMSSDQLTDRFIAAEAHVDLWRLRTGRLNADSDDFTRIRDALDRLSKAPIYIYDEAGINILQMRAMARRLQAEKGLKLIIVDYLQLIQPRANTDNIVQQITEISRSLKGLARELSIPVLALSQLSRAVESRHPPIPKLSDLRESGSIEQDADVVMFIYRDDRYRPNSDRPNQADIMIQKHRNGPLGQATLYFNQAWTSFSALAKEGHVPADH
ncbi:MAG: replicative DNA helicase [Candidatus Niyogibacteria bacterium]|nr:replicative DNA helicase [Candidatus Niyogibacteria bacterium]